MKSIFIAIGSAVIGVNAASAQWQSGDGFRFAPLAIPVEGKTGFTLMRESATGVAFTNLVDEWASASNRVLLNGSGVAVGDYDGDSRPDIFFCSLNGRNTLYRNLGQWRFSDVTEAVGLGRDHRYYRGAVFADVNGDGAVDLLVAVLGGGVECHLNDGQGKFTNSTPAARTSSPFGSMTMALADVDGNGTLDLYVANNRTEDIRDRGQTNLRLVNGQMVVPPELKDRLVVVNGEVWEYGEPDQLYLNDGRGRFAPVSWTGGRFRNEDGAPLTGPPLDWGLAAMFRDINGDGFPDLYVCNDFWTPDRIWLNDGKGRFQAAPRLAFRNTSASSMGVDFADLDRDGFPECFVVDMLSRDPRLRLRQAPAQAARSSPVGVIDDRPQFMRNTLFRNRGDGTFVELANFAGLAASEWSWSPIFLDVDLDGYEDVLIASGHARDVQDLDAQAQIRARQHSWKGFASEAERQKAFTRELMEHMHLYPRLDMPIVAFRNKGAFRFEETTPLWGTAQPGVHHAMATADFDGDGDLDLVVNNLEAAAGLYRNESIAPRVAVRLKGRAPNSQGIGAKVTLLGGAVPSQSQEMISGGRYLAGCDPELVFASGGTASNMTLEVTWRSGQQSRVAHVRANCLYEISEPASGLPEKKSARAPSAPMFVEAVPALDHKHHEIAFDDFALQPLLPFKLSQAGPAVAWFDLDGDGKEELWLGAGRGGTIRGFRFAGPNQVESIEAAGAPLADDTSGIVGWTSASGRRTLLIGLSGYENPSASRMVAGQLDGGRLVQRTNFLESGDWGGGALAVADLDGDGDLDLFVGGGVIRGRYPEARPSRVFRCVDDRLEMDAENSRALSGAGLVNGAVWSDLDNDGFPELILAGEWAPVRVYANRSGRLTETTKELGLDAYTGWWKGVTTGDIDGDGHLDIVAGNWGLNSPYHAGPEAPLVLFHGDLAERGVNELVEVDGSYPRRFLEALASGMPFLWEGTPTHKAFSETSVASLLGDRLSRMRKAEATTLASTVFFQRARRFIAMPLPPETQWAPAFDVKVADLNGDGREDIFLTQNFFATRPGLPRLDGGCGLWLRGAGGTNLIAVPAMESGIRVFGEQRGAAFADFDRDGRVDVVVSQNGGATKVFRNEGGAPGWRVRLKGPPGNPHGLGARVRLQHGGQWGPWREFHGSSGYQSFNSAVEILATPQVPHAIEVCWPGGKRTSITRIPTPNPQSPELVIGLNGLE
jgi:hypothetical protein